MYHLDTSGNPWRCVAGRDSLGAGRGISAVQPGFWDVQDRLRELSERGDPLEKLEATIDFEIFRGDLAVALGSRDRSRRGPPAFEPVLKFRMLVQPAMYGLSQTEYLVADRLSWMRFCGIDPGDAVPDANTLWDFRAAPIHRPMRAGGHEFRRRLPSSTRA